MFKIWRLREAGRDNLGLAFTDEALVLGRTPLVERQQGRFVVRHQAEIERLLARAYGREREPAAGRLMSGLATVAAALNANDGCLARIAAVHLKIRDLPDAETRHAVEVEDALLKSTDWNPDLHPRAGVPPNPGWFAPTEGSSEETPSTRLASNDDSTSRSDASASLSNDDWAKLPPGRYIDELHDFLEWLANAEPQDETAIRAEIKRYYYDVGDTVGGDALNRVLSDVLEAGPDRETRQELLNGIQAYAKTDPAEIAQDRNLAVGAILLLFGREPIAETADAPADGWKLGWAARGQYFDALLRDGSLPPGFQTIDNFTNGIATSIKSIDLNAATYQDAARLFPRRHILQGKSYVFHQQAFVFATDRASSVGHFLQCLLREIHARLQIKRSSVYSFYAVQPIGEMAARNFSRDCQRKARQSFGITRCLEVRARRASKDDGPSARAETLEACHGTSKPRDCRISRPDDTLRAILMHNGPANLRRIDESLDHGLPRPFSRHRQARAGRPQRRSQRAVARHYLDRE